MLPQCLDMGVGVIPWSPLARGRLARPPEETGATVRSEEDSFSEHLYQDAESDILAVVAELAEEHGVTLAQVALAWLLHRFEVTAPIVGATKLHHLEDAVAATELELKPEEVERLEAPYRPRPVLGHR